MRACHRLPILLLATPWHLQTHFVFCLKTRDFSRCVMLRISQKTNMLESDCQIWKRGSWDTRFWWNSHCRLSDGHAVKRRPRRGGHSRLTFPPTRNDRTSGFQGPRGPMEAVVSIQSCGIWWRYQCREPFLVTGWRCSYQNIWKRSLKKGGLSHQGMNQVRWAEVLTTTGHENNQVLRCRLSSHLPFW